MRRGADPSAAARPVEDPRRVRWERLTKLCERLEHDGASALTPAEAREITQLYRAASSDLLEELRRDPDSAASEYLRALAARAHGLLHRGAPPRLVEAMGRFFAREFPRTLRRRFRALLLALAVFLAGATFGAVEMARDPGAGEVLLVLGNRGIDPRKRVEEAEKASTVATVPLQALGGTTFAAWLFEHNSRVAFLAFALGVTGGVGTVLVLFANGAFLGAVAIRYVMSGEGLFLAGWISPHAVLEIPAILIASAAGLIVGRALFAPGLAGRRRALHTAGRDALALVLGATATLLVAGLIEGTVSQVHAPVLPYEAKIGFAIVVGAAYASYLLFAGSRARAGAGDQSP